MGKKKWLTHLFLNLFLFLLLIACNGKQESQNIAEPIEVDFEELAVPIFNIGFSCNDNESDTILVLKAYLVEKYNPGFCFGMPSIEYGSPSTAIEAYPRTANFVKERFGISYEYNVYTKMRQICSIKLTESGSVYEFVFTDGKCCTISTIEGIIYFDDEEIIDEIKKTETKVVPC